MDEARPGPAGVPGVDCERCHPILFVADVSRAVEFYTSKLGFWCAFVEGEPPAFAGVNLGDVQMFLERGTPSPAGCSVYFVVTDADTLHDFHRSRGVHVIEAPADRAYKLRDYTVEDLHGYRVTFGHRLLTTQARES